MWCAPWVGKANRSIKTLMLRSHQRANKNIWRSQSAVGDTGRCVLVSPFTTSCPEEGSWRQTAEQVKVAGLHAQHFRADFIENRLEFARKKSANPVRYSLKTRGIDARVGLGSRVLRLPGNLN
jgi:hypothetical protein